MDGENTSTTAAPDKGAAWPCSDPEEFARVVNADPSRQSLADAAATALENIRDAIAFAPARTPGGVVFVLSPQTLAKLYQGWCRSQE